MRLVIYKHKRNCPKGGKHRCRIIGRRGMTGRNYLRCRHCFHTVGYWRDPLDPGPRDSFPLAG